RPSTTGSPAGFWKTRSGCCTTCWRKTMTEHPFLNKIHHVAIIASDYAASRHFYVDLLGFAVVRENLRPQRGDHKLDLRLGDCELEIFGIPGAPARPNYPEACGLRHLA